MDPYNKVRLNTAIGYITQKDMLAAATAGDPSRGDRKLEAAQTQRQIRQKQALDRGELSDYHRYAQAIQDVLRTA